MELRSVEWICFASITFDALLPVYPCVERMPAYLSEVSLDVSTENFYWASAVLCALADHSYHKSNRDIVRYQDAVMTRGRRLLREYDQKMLETGDYSLAAEANDKLAQMAKEETFRVLYRVLRAASEGMKNGYNRADY